MAIAQVLTCGRDEETLSAAIADWKGQGLEVDVSPCCSAETALCTADAARQTHSCVREARSLADASSHDVCKQLQTSSEPLLQTSCAMMLGGFRRV